MKKFKTSLGKSHKDQNGNGRIFWPSGYCCPSPLRCSRVYGRASRTGFAVDLMTQRRDGQFWDLSKKEHQEELEKIQREQDPYLLTGSPPCDPFSSWQQVNKVRNLKEPLAEKLRRGRQHLRVACKAYKRQVEKGPLLLA